MEPHKIKDEHTKYIFYVSTTTPTLVHDVCKNAGSSYFSTTLREITSSTFGACGLKSRSINEVVAVVGSLAPTQFGAEHSFGGFPVVGNITESFSHKHLKKA